MRYLIADWRPTCSPNTAVIHSELRDLSKYLKYKLIRPSDNVCPSVFSFSFLIIIFFLTLALFYFFSFSDYSFYSYFSLLHTPLLCSFRPIFSSSPSSSFLLHSSSIFFLFLDTAYPSPIQLYWSLRNVLCISLNLSVYLDVYFRVFNFHLDY